MKYELAKELMDAGFPRPENWGKQYLPEDPEEYKMFYPTLSELIEACGVEHIWNEKTYQFHMLYSNGMWFAQYDDQDFNLPNPLPQGKGTTPKEAVSRLWLALKKSPAIKQG